MFLQMTPELLGGHVNTYTFTKALAENLLKQESQNLPLVIVRPSMGKSAFNALYANFKTFYY